MTSRASALPLAAMIAVVVAGHLSLFPNVADLDGFYHIGHAAAYLQGSLFDTGLPWASRSIIGDRGGDLWWGFHVLLLPFAALGSVSAGLRLAALALTSGLTFVVYRVLIRHGVAGAGWWAALFMVAVPNVFFRYLMVRPHVVSLAASILLLSVLVRGRWWHVVLLGALMSWVHLSLFWMAPCLVVAYAIVRIPVTVALGRDRPDAGVPIRQAIPAVIAGTIAGWLLRPDAWDTATLLNIQLVQLFALKATDQPLTFAAELSPIAPLELLRTTWLFSVAWVVAVGLTARHAYRGRLDELGQGRATFLLTSMIVSGVFLILALFSARRAMEQWVAFGFLTFPLLATITPTESLRRPVRFSVGVLLTAHLAWGAWRHDLNTSLVASPADTMRDVAGFLEANSEPGEVVFHTKWDNFGPLFAFNRSNHYLGGMDPIFQYAHDDRAFWEFFYLSSDATSEWTCDAWPCIEGNATDTWIVLRDHFRTRWVVVEPRRNPRFTLFLLNDPRFRLALETRREALFELIPQPAAPAGPGS